MPVLPRPIAPTHEIPGASFTSLATPTTGSVDTAVWEVRLEPGHAGVPHELTRQEVFVITSGNGRASIAGVDHAVRAGDVVVVPSATQFRLESSVDEPLVALCCFPTDGKAVLGGTEPFTPPWAI